MTTNDCEELLLISASLQLNKLDWNQKTAALTSDVGGLLVVRKEISDFPEPIAISPQPKLWLTQKSGPGKKATRNQTGMKARNIDCMERKLKIVHTVDCGDVNCIECDKIQYACFHPEWTDPVPRCALFNETLVDESDDYSLLLRCEACLNAESKQEKT